MSIVSDADCQEKMDQYELTIAGSMLCAGGEGKATCNVGFKAISLACSKQLVNKK